MTAWADFIADHHDDAAAEILRGLTADIRHEERIWAVHRAAICSLAAIEWIAYSEDAQLDAIALLCETELLGCGGPGGLATLHRQRADYRTTRMAWAATLGAGRRRAGDGPAWDAAIAAAAARWERRLPTGERYAQWVWADPDPDTDGADHGPGLYMSIIGARLAWGMIDPAHAVTVSAARARSFYELANAAAALKWAAHYQALCQEQEG